MPVTRMREWRYGSCVLRDASAEAERIQLELLRAMSPVQKAQLVSELTRAVQRLAFAGARMADPEATDEEIWLRLAARRLGSEAVRRVYGFDPAAILDAMQTGM